MAKFIRFCCLNKFLVWTNGASLFIELHAFSTQGDGCMNVIIGRRQFAYCIELNNFVYSGIAYFFARHAFNKIDEYYLLQNSFNSLALRMG